MQTFKYGDLLERLKGFDPWLIKLGVKPRNDDRLHHAFGILRLAEAATRKGHETGEYSNIQPEHLFPLVEALEAYDIFTVFERDSSKELANALKRALSGPAQPVDEKNEASRDGRNVWFELALASEWKLRGASVCLGEPDIKLSSHNRKFLVACKRPASANSVRSNIRSAIKQLNQSLRLAPDSFGIIAISLSRVFNPGTSFWSGSLEQLGNRLQDLMIANSPQWRSADANPRICSILFHAATPSNLGEKVDLSLAKYSVAAPFKEISAGTRAFKEHLREMKAQSL